MVALEGLVPSKAEGDTGWLFPVGDEIGSLGYVEMFKDMFNSMDKGVKPMETFYDGYIVNAIIDAVKSTLDRTPPELASDIMDRGIVVTGGGALLHGLDERLRHETGMPTIIAENPLNAVVMGSGKCVEEFESLQQVLISEPRH